MAPVATDLAARLMPQDKCKCRANPPKAPIGKFEHQSGKIDQPMERFAPGEAGGWSDSPQGVERFAPGGGANRPTRQPAHDLDWESRAPIGNRAHESGNFSTNREWRAPIGKFQHESGIARTNRAPERPCRS